MKKYLIAGASALALIVPSTASADVPRCEVPVTSTTSATFHLYNPKGVVGQWEDVWVHDFAITVKPDGTFTGTGTEHNITGDISVDVRVAGQIEADNKISFTVTQVGSDVSQTVTSQVTDSTSKDTGTISKSTTYPVVGWDVEARITAPQFAVVTTTDVNHGQYVSTSGGGKDAAQKCAGMPLNSKQGK
jgi:hypothetical protein